MVIGYARVSTEQQGTEAQLPDPRKAGCKRVYQETVGGGTMDRPELEKCLERLDQGDTLVVWRLDRLRRSIRDLLQIVDRLDKRGINFISLKERFDTSTAAGRLVFHFFAALTQFEKELIRERTMAGLSSAVEDNQATAKNLARFRLTIEIFRAGVSTNSFPWTTAIALCNFRRGFSNVQCQIGCN